MGGNLGRLFCLAALLALAGCSAIIDKQVSCKSNADCTSPAACVDSLCVIAGGADASLPGDASVPPSPDGGLPGVVFAVDVSGQQVAGVAATVTVTAKTSAGTDEGYTGSVTLTSSDPQAVLPAAYAFTGADKGVHAFSGVVFKTAGQISVTARDGAGTTGQASLTVGAAAAAKLAVTGLPGTAGAGQRVSATVKALDAFGNVATGYTGTVTFTSSDPVAKLPADYPFVAADSGAHSFSNGVEFDTDGSQTVTATDTATAITGTSAPVTVGAGAASQLVLTGPTAPVNAGAPQDLTVTAADSSGNTADGYTGTIHFTTTSPSPVTLPLDYQFVAADHGSHTFTNGVVLNKVNTWSVTATDTQVSSITGMLSIQVQVGPAAKLAFTQTPATDVDTDTVISPAILVEIRDAADNKVPSAQNSVTIALGNFPAGATLGGTATKAAASGVATFADLEVDTDGTYTLVATATGLTSATSSSFQATSCGDHKAGLGCADCVTGYHHPSGSTDCETMCQDPGECGTGTAPAATCYGNSVRTSASTGTCTPTTSGNFFTCDYVTTDTPCASGTYCDDSTGPASCVDPCSPMPDDCTTQTTADSCDGNHKLVSYSPTCTATSATGHTCGSTSGQDSACPSSAPWCNQLASSAECVDPCASLTCSDQVTCSSNGKTMTTYSSSCVATSATAASCVTSTTGSDTPCGTGYCDAANARCATPCDHNICTPLASMCKDSKTLTTYTATCDADSPTHYNCGNSGADSDCTATSGEVCFAGQCQALPTPTASQLLITEVMASPNGPGGSAGGAAYQWIELYNLDDTVAVNLAGLTIEEHLGSQSFTLDAATPAILSPNGYLVVGGSVNTLLNGGATVDLAWPSASSFQLSGSGDLRVWKGGLSGTLLEEFAWDGTAIPNHQGNAMNLSSKAYAKGANLYPGYWCDAVPVANYGSMNNNGTPDSDNNDCGAPVPPAITWCIAQLIDTPTAGTATNAHGRVFAHGITDRNQLGNDGYLLLSGQFGYGPAGTTDGKNQFAWTDAGFNPLWAPGSCPDCYDDEMVAKVTFPDSISYAWGYRFQVYDPVAGKASDWVYCNQVGVVGNPTNDSWATITVN